MSPRKGKKISNKTSAAVGVNTESEEPVEERPHATIPGQTSPRAINRASMNVLQAIRRKRKPSKVAVCLFLIPCFIVLGLFIWKRTTDKTNEEYLEELMREAVAIEISDYSTLIHPFSIYLPGSSAEQTSRNELFSVFNKATFVNKSRVHLHKFNRAGNRRFRPFDAKLPIVFVITPTYTRHVQKAELTHMCSTLRHVRNLVWIVVEDSENKTDLVISFLSRCGVPAVHLNIKSIFRPELTIHQRNSALQWIRDYADVTTRDGVFCFADDDNTYDPEIFDQMRYTQKVSVWPVGFAGDTLVEGPLVMNGKVVDWISSFAVNERRFPIDMAGFAINIQLLHEHPTARFSHYMGAYYLETSFIELFHVDNEDLEPLANNCTEVLVWHTQRSKLKLSFPGRTKRNMTSPLQWPEV